MEHEKRNAPTSSKSANITISKSCPATSNLEVCMDAETTANDAALAAALAEIFTSEEENEEEDENEDQYEYEYDQLGSQVNNEEEEVASTSLNDMCMSPPTSTRTLKRISKKNKKKTSDLSATGTTASAAGEFRVKHLTKPKKHILV